MSGITCNIASHLPAMAARQPNKAALVAVAGRGADGRARYRQFSFAELNEASDCYARGLERVGICRGVRTVLMVRPSLEFFALVFALFKVGAVPVLVDPAIGLKKLRTCLQEVEPGAFIGLSVAHVARLLMGRALASIRVNVTVGARWFWGGYRLRQLKDESGPAYVMADTEPDETAAILFTSGSTGVPKGAIYSHGMFSAQVDMLAAMYRFSDDEIDLPTFPLFALFDPALGMTAVLPEMDFAKPGSADPALLVEAITDYGCTNMFGSPALLRNLAQYGRTEELKLPSLRRVLSAGAPVSHEVLRGITAMLTEGAQVFTPYGATESLPVANIGSAEVLAETAAATAAGQGICVGRPVDGMSVRIIKISDEPIATWSEDLLVEDGMIGEITVQGPVVSAAYWARPEQTAAAKIRRDDGAVVHRMGDLGWLDPQGRLWMCGRKNHRVETEQGALFTIPIERIFDTHPGLSRTALVGTGPRGSQRPLLLVEQNGLAVDLGFDALCSQLRELGRRYEPSRSIDEFMLYPGSFPVDVRHNAKINREELTLWAQGRSS